MARTREASLEIRLLGSPEVADDLGRPVAVRGSRPTTLVIALALRCGHLVTDDRLLEILGGARIRLIRAWKPPRADSA